MATISFAAVMNIVNVNPYVLVSAARVARIKSNWRKPLPVLVRINGEPQQPWRINLMPKGNGDFYLYLHGAIRKASGTKVGDRVRVEIAFDRAYKNGPMHPMPVWFRGPLAKHPDAKKAWEALIPSRRKEILRYFAGLKSAEARTRNVAKALDVLSGKPKRFMARAWEKGK